MPSGYHRTDNSLRTRQLRDRRVQDKKRKDRKDARAYARQHTH